MTVIGIDDTDSREQGMCTTYVAARLAETLAAAGVSIERTLLVRLHPAIEHKTRGNAALAVHCDADSGTALEHVREVIDLAVTGDDRTNPGAVVAEVPPDEVSGPVAAFAERAVGERCSREEARRLCEQAGFQRVTRGNGRGVVGALAAAGAWRAFDSWTVECLSYRERERWGTDRRVDHDSVFRAADACYPAVWDTVDRIENTAVCVPRTPGPVLHGIRGETPEAVRTVADRIESEPVARRRLFVTNQGTDAHLRDAALSELADGGCYRVDATVATAPETHEGGHVFLALGDDGAAGGDEEDNADDQVRAAAFEPTKRFRDRVRALRPGDRVTACGEVSDGTLKLEKFAVRDLVRTERVTPTCPDCGRSMSSAGRNAGYRCRDCGTAAEEKVERPVERDLELGWYEVPPCARRHVAKPLVRGGFDAPTHPER